MKSHRRKPKELRDGKLPLEDMMKHTKEEADFIDGTTKGKSKPASGGRDINGGMKGKKEIPNRGKTKIKGEK